MIQRHIHRCPFLMFLVVGSLLFSFSLSPAFGQVRLQRLLEHQVLMVVDVNDKRVGQVIATQPGDNGDPTVYFRINGQAVKLDVGVRELHGVNGDTVYFASTNCTGQGFIEFDAPEPLFSKVAVLAPGNTVKFISIKPSVAME